jgi:hypothetical protein
LGLGSRGCVSLGDLEQLDNLLQNKSLNVEVNPKMDKCGKFYPGESLLMGKTGFRNDLLKLRDSEDSCSPRPGMTIWHELLHGIIYYKFPKDKRPPCGQEESYLDLCEKRSDWLAKVAIFEQNFEDQRWSAQGLRERFEFLKRLYQNFNYGEGSQQFRNPIQNLSGPFTFADSDNSCGGGAARTYSITPKDVQKFDSLLSMRVDLACIENAHKYFLDELEKLQDNSPDRELT